MCCNLQIKKMPEEWRISILVSIHNNKGDIQNCKKYGRIKLMGPRGKLYERVIERRLRLESNIS